MPRFSTSTADGSQRTVHSGRSTVDGVYWTFLVAGVGNFMWTYTLSSILLRIITVNIEGVTQIMK